VVGPTDGGRFADKTAEVADRRASLAPFLCSVVEWRFHMSRTKLVLAAVASVAIAAIGCENRENDARAAGGIRELTIATFGPGVLAGVGGGPRDAANVRTPDEPTFSSAVTPLGWTDEAERREAERAFANGEEAAAPHAIGGGPVNFEE
jgi:hypothetical protein